jgi:hypothetical protein
MADLSAWLCVQDAARAFAAKAFTHELAAFGVDVPACAGADVRRTRHSCSAVRGGSV